MDHFNLITNLLYIVQYQRAVSQALLDRVSDDKANETIIVRLRSCWHYFFVRYFCLELREELTTQE